MFVFHFVKRACYGMIRWRRLTAVTICTLIPILIAAVLMSTASLREQSIAYAALDANSQFAFQAQNDPQLLLPVSNLPIVGNYCTVQAGASLHDPPHNGQFSVDVAGTPIRSYWFWTGRSVDSPIGDDSIVVNIENANGIAEVELVAQQVLSSNDRAFTWHSNGYRDDGLAYVTEGTNTYDVSGLMIDNNAEFNHGVGVVIIYESNHCPYTKVTGWFGIDSFHWTRTGELGPDSNVMCEVFPASALTRTLSFNMAIGGVATAERGNSIWYITGQGEQPTAITPDLDNQPNPSAIEIFDPLNGNPGREWDFNHAELVIPPGDTYACAQIESPADDDGISAVWSGLVTSLPLDPPNIAIEKRADPSLVRSGSSVTFTVQLTNTGSVTLTDVVVSDPLVPGCNASYPLLIPGATQSYSCQGIDVTESFTNVIEVSGNPPSGLPVTDSDDAPVAVYTPAIEILKTPDLQTVVTGATAVFTITVRNSGNIELTNVTVTDAIAPDCNQTITEPMGPGEERSYTCSLDNIDADFVNIADVSGMPPQGPAVTDSDDATVTVTPPSETPLPGISIEKLPDQQSVLVGLTATFTISVENIGGTPLTNVSVTDSNTPLCDRTFPGLEIGQTITYSCLAPNVTAPFTNIAMVSAQPSDGPTVSDSDDAVVTTLGPGIQIEKGPDAQTVPSGGDVLFTITVTNIGDVELSDVEVSDGVAPACAATLGKLEPGEKISYTCSLNNVEASLINVATVTANPPSGSAIMDQDDAEVTVAYPDITIVKSGSSKVLVTGSPAIFTIQVTNSGEVTLSDVTVVDTLVPACDAELGTLKPGDVKEYSCTLDALVHSMMNIATVSGRSPSGEVVTDDDQATVIPLTPEISIDKQPDLQIIRIGETAIFTLAVQNVGEVNLAAVTVSDLLAPGCDRQLGNLPVGEKRTYSCTLTDVSGPLTNTAIVTGTPILTNGDDTTSDVVHEDVWSRDTATVKTTTLATIGDRVWFDQNVNGMQDSNEVGVEGITVILQDDSSNILSTTTTDSDGNYLFPDLPAGDYQVEFSLIDGFSFTPSQQGDATLDSDPDTITGRTDTIQLSVDEINRDIDAGLVGTPALVLTKTDDDQVAQPGGTIIYTLTVTNTGNTTALGVMITEYMPNNTIYMEDGSTRGWACGVVAPGDTQCTFDVGDLNPSESMTVTFAVTVKTPLPIAIAVINNEATVSSTNGISGKRVVTEITPLTPTALEGTNEPSLRQRFYIPIVR